MNLKNIFLMAVLAFVSCSEADEKDFNNCTNSCVVIDQNLYNNTSSANYGILDVRLNGDLLTVNISSGGCDGSRWIVNLVDANQILESNPIQRNIKISLVNNEDCLAVVSKDFTFNIKELKGNQPEVILNLEGWDTQIKY